MRPSLQAFMKKIKSKTVFIVGGGPSAKNVDFALLQNEIVICINDSYEDFPNATGIYWVDESWVSENYDSLILHNCKMKFTSKPSQHISYAVNGDPVGICKAAILKRTGDFGFDENIDCIMGNNSGVQVLNLVVNMKPKKVILIGFDMKKDGNSTHYHNKARLPANYDTIYTDLFIPSMNALAKGMKKSGCRVKIINANTDSGIRCFEFGEYTDYLSNK